MIAMIFGSKAKDKAILMISVQSSIVRVTIVHLSKSQLPLILFNSSKFIKQRDDVDANYLVKATTNHISEGVDEALKEFHAMRHADMRLPHSISEVHFVLSSPWIASHARKLSKAFSKPAAITSKGIKEMISGERSKYLAIDSSRQDIVEEKIFDIRLNGYSIPEWEGKMANSMDISFATSVVGKAVIERFEEACAHVVHKNNVHFHSSLLLHHIGTQQILPNKASYVLVHIHGELTDVVIVDQQMCVFFGSFSRGINTVVRSIAHAMQTSDSMADSYLTMYLSGKTVPDADRKSIDIIQDVQRGWMGEFLKLLKNSGYTGYIPESVMISSRIHEPFFIDSYKKKYPNAEVEIVTKEMLSVGVKYAPKAEQLRVLGLYAIALNIIA